MNRPVPLQTEPGALLDRASVILRYYNGGTQGLAIEPTNVITPFNTAFTKPADGDRVDLVLTYEHSLRQALGGIVVIDVQPRLEYRWPAVEFGRDKVYGCAVFEISRFQCTLMCL